MVEADLERAEERAEAGEKYDRNSFLTKWKIWGDKKELFCIISDRMRKSK